MAESPEKAAESKTSELKRLKQMESELQEMLEKLAIARANAQQDLDSTKKQVDEVADTAQKVELLSDRLSDQLSDRSKISTKKRKPGDRQPQTAAENKFAAIEKLIAGRPVQMEQVQGSADYLQPEPEPEPQEFTEDDYQYFYQQQQQPVQYQNYQFYPTQSSQQFPHQQQPVQDAEAEPTNNKLWMGLLFGVVVGAGGAFLANQYFANQETQASSSTLSTSSRPASTTKPKTNNTKRSSRSVRSGRI